MSLLVAKIGGSLADSALLDGWLDAFAAARQPLVLVPGGGPLARDVRIEQDALGFDDEEAHRRALLAMERFGAILAGHSHRLVTVATRAAIMSALARDKIPVWLPSKMALAAREIPRSWDVTSDSLAAWLAGACDADRLLLVKSVDAKEPASLRSLAMNKTVDPLFARFAVRGGARIFIAGPAASAFAREILQGGGVPGARVRMETNRSAPAP